jgi:hypothetical protein
MRDILNSSRNFLLWYKPLKLPCDFLQGLLVEHKRLQVNCDQYAYDKCHGQMRRAQFPISTPSKCVNFSFSLEVIKNKEPSFLQASDPKD